MARFEILYPPFPAGVPGFPSALRAAFDSTAPALLEPPQGRALAMVARPFDESATVNLRFPPYPAGMMESLSGVHTTVLGAAATVVASTHGYNSQAGDDPANTHFPPLLAEGFNFGGQLFEGTDPGVAGKRAAVDLAGKGTIVLTDPAGELDAAARDYAWDGRDIRLYRGDPAAAFSTWEQVAKLTSEGLFYSPSRKTIRLRDLQWRLYGARLLDLRYDGTGGINGDSGAAGLFRPHAYGRVKNVLPRLIDGANKVYQWHDRRVQGVTALRDGVSAVVIDGDDPDLATLLAASIAVGHARTCNALGLVRLGFTPGLGLRLDGQGDAQGSYVETRGGIVRRLATTRGPAPFADTSEIDTLAFSLLDARQPGPVGLYVDDERTIGAALDDLMQGCAGWWFVDLDGALTASELREPDVNPEILLLHPSDVKSEPEMYARTAPRFQTRVGYQFNNAPQTPAELGAATEAEQRLYGDQWRFGIATDDFVRTKYPTATAVDIPGHFALESNATAEAARQQILFGEYRERWKVRVRIDPFAKALGKTLGLSGFPARLGLGALKLFRVVGVTAVAGLGEAELDLWC